MLRKVIIWFIIYGLSFMVQAFGLTDQGTAFLYINIGGITLVYATAFLLYLFGPFNSIVKKFVLSFRVAIIYAITLGITLLATWIATQLFDVEFAVIYQIMTFGACLHDDSKESDD